MSKKVIANVRVGEADVHPAAPSHTPGVGQGNAPDRAQVDIIDEGMKARATARRSTGINADQRMPISSDMPVLTPQ